MAINTFKNIIKIILVFIFASNPAFMYAIEDGGKQPKFKGTVKLPGNLVSSSDSLCIMYNAPYSLLGMNNEGMYLTTDKTGNFEFKLPRYAHLNRVQISLRRNGRYIKLSDHYLVDPQDDIMINIVKHPDFITAVFSGYGAEKYNVTTKLENLEKELLNKMHTLKFSEPNNFASKLLAYNQFTDELIIKKDSILRNTALDTQMKKILMYEFGNIFFEWAFRHYTHYANRYKGNPEVRALIRANYNANKQKYSYEDDPITSLCAKYLSMLSLIEAYNVLFAQDTANLNSEAFYNHLKNKYTGLPRQLMLSNIVLRFSGYINEIKIDRSKIDSLQNDAYQYITLQNLKETYTHALKLVKGKTVFASTFVDEKGNEISLESLKGKVVLIDMWNVGCGACATYHKEFNKNIYPQVKNNKDFVYLSIGNDNTKEKWLEGIKSGKYTSSAYLNVNANYLGLAHPFAKNYNIRGLPFALLVDRNGKIHTSIMGDGSINDLKFINEALDKP